MDSRLKPEALRHFQREVAFLRRRLSPEGAFGLHLTIGLLVIILGFWCFAGIAEDLVPGDPLVLRDAQVANWFHAHASPQWTAIARVATTFGSLAFLSAASLICALVLVWRKAWRRLLAFAGIMIGGSVLNIALKHFFHRQRPVLGNPLVTLTSYGFPSGHTMGATLFYGALAIFAVYSIKSWTMRALVAALACLIVVLIGLTRIYLGAHFLTDVLAACAAGAVWLAFCWAASETLRKHRKRPAAGDSESNQPFTAL